MVGVKTLIHYLDLFLDPPNTCMDLLKYFFSICEAFGVPLTQEKNVFPSVCLEFLGITIDTVHIEFRLPMEKNFRLMGCIMLLIRKNKVTLKEVQPLLGQLAFAVRIMPIGRIFSRRLYLAIAGLKSQSAQVRISHDIWEDLMVWLRVLEYFNGRAV